MRQFAQGLFLLLGQTLDLVTDHKEECAGNNLFINSKTCRFYGINDASQIRHFCKGEPFVHYDQVWKFNSTNTDGTINDTPLLDNLRAQDTLDVHILPFLHNTSTTFPQPLPFWSSYPAVGPNKPQRFMKKQGPGPTKKYNAAIRNALEELSPGEAYEGAWRQLEWYNVTDGAVSYDGTHYSYQVAMERAQIFLNTLDVVWGEIVEHGGLVQDAVQ
ncbi:hypothetical protein Rhopal_006849-T1 [Rhodotorula paludigena]|uniref:Uncharacterized protein n=1 Tax=Rhodotorula paludigena TaxID=86838 RepID=A0AAV5GWB6_9BASI|nr:hypothetical protein Rhopal_006849-T1 [Rhodotorula paludigena]